MKNTTNNTANEMLKLIVLRDKFEGRMDYGKIHAVEYHTEKLINAVGALTTDARKDGFTEDEIDTMLEYLEVKVKQEMKSKQ